MSTEPTRCDIRSRLIVLINEIAGIPADKVIDTATIDAELTMESVAFVELQVAIEDEFNIRTDTIRIVELNQFGAIVDYVLELAVEAVA